MQTSHVRTAVRAATSIASAFDLPVDDVVVLQDSDKLTVRLLPCDTVARVAHGGQDAAELEVELAKRLAATRSPAVTLEPRVEPRVYVHEGFTVTLWSYHEPVSTREAEPAEYADALARLHAGMRQIDMSMPHFTDRVANARSLLADRSRTRTQLGGTNFESTVSPVTVRRPGEEYPGPVTRERLDARQ